MFDVGSRIAYFRKLNKWSQQTLAEQLDISREALNRIENNKNRPALETIERFCELADIDLAVFFGGYVQSIPNHLITIVENAQKLSFEQCQALERFLETL